MKFSTRLEYVCAFLVMGALIVWHRYWGEWLPDDYPYELWIRYGLMVPTGFSLAVSLGMGTGNPERSVLALWCGVTVATLAALLPDTTLDVVLNRLIPLALGAFVQWLLARK
ncbi:hypothetical protein [uncultured Alistipes sp.]|uniref:hypothetical protein n=1 Tax=uncultured Alistipes sp. TaxID=538949 RepID=UPI002612422C|nr:hypothetical protein [uncultured Alistipes sp.]